VLHEVHRFRYAPRHRDGRLRWDIESLLAGVATSLARAGAGAAVLGGALTSIGVDSWGVDYGLVDAAGRLLEAPICYRDDRTATAIDEVFARLPREELFARTGIQFLAFNTLFQLAAHVRDGIPAAASRLLLVPDLCHHFLCGSSVTERTNASTTQLLDARRGEWDDEIFRRLGLPRELMPEVVEAGTELGRLTAERQAASGLAAVPIISPATHDTASAVMGTPLQAGWAYISSGTWSLVGIERDAPLMDKAAGRANFTNERGAFGTVRLLRNVMGLWILDSCRKEWAARGKGMDHADLLSAVGSLEEFAGFIVPDDPRFFSPASMIAELRAALAASGRSTPDDPPRLAKIVLDSLALRYASVVRTIERLTGRQVPGIHIVGGGALNDYLNQSTADAANRPVLAGPVEATALGNVIVQSIAGGEISSIGEARRLLSIHLRPRRYFPRRAGAWAEAASRYLELEGRTSIDGAGR
jgi:rhamnulokinase